MEINWRSSVALVFVALIIMLQILYWIDPLTLQDIALLRDELLLLVQSYPVISSAVYILIYTLSIIFGIPVSATLIGGYLFGIVYGTVYTFIAIILGSTLLCSFARYVMHDWIEKRYEKQLDYFDSEIQKYGAFYIVMIHAIPFAPSFLPHIAAGLSSLPLYQIVLANSFGALPLTLLYATAGYYLHSLASLRAFTMYMMVFGIFLVALWGGVIFIRYVLQKKG